MRSARIILALTAVAVLTFGSAAAQKQVETPGDLSLRGLDVNNYELRDLFRLQHESTTGTRIREPGVYPAKGCVAPGLIPDEFDPGILDLGPDVYIGTVTIVALGDRGRKATFRGHRSDGASGNADGTFSADWAGFELGPIIIGTELEQGCIIHIDVEELRFGKVNGVGHVDGENWRYIAKFGEGGVLVSQKIVPAPAIYR